VPLRGGNQPCFSQPVPIHWVLPFLLFIDPIAAFSPFWPLPWQQLLPSIPREAISLEELNP